jgi:hypothetical protein
MNRENREITKENEAWGRRILTFQGALNAKEKWERLEGPGNVRVARGEEGRWKKSGGLASPSPAAWPWRSLSERCVWREKRREAEAGGENMLCPATARRLLLPPPVGLRVGWFVVAGFALCLPRTEDGRRGPPGPGGPHQTTGIPFEKDVLFPSILLDY